MSFPVAFTDAPVEMSDIAFSMFSAFDGVAGFDLSNVSCMFAKQEPSFTWTKTRFFESRIVRTHPQTVTVLPSGAEVKMSLISSVFIILDFIRMEPCIQFGEFGEFAEFYSARPQSDF